MPVMSDALYDMQQFFALASTQRQGISVDQELCKSFADALEEIREAVQTAEAFLVSQAVIAEMSSSSEEGDNVVPFRPRQRPAFCDGRGGGGAA